MTSIFDRWTDLDPALALRRIEAAHGTPIFDRYSYLDSERAIKQIEDALSISLDDVTGVLNFRFLEAAIDAAVAGDSGGDYVAKAVSFNNTTTWIRRALPIVGGITIHKYLASWWFKDMTELAGNTAHSISCFCTYPNVEMEFTGVFASAGNSIFATLNQNNIATVMNGATSGSDSAVFPGSGWMHAVMSFDATNGDPNNVYQLYVNGVPVSVSQVYPGTHPEGFMDFGSFSQETDIFFLEDGYGDEKTTGSVADIQLWCGIAPDLSVPANLAKIIAAGKPVDPAVAAVAFGQQTFLFSGDASSFANNQGTAGTCVLTGTLTNATTSPSDA